MEGNVGSILLEGPLIVFSSHIVIFSALIATLLLYIVSWKKPSLTRFSMPIVIAAWAISAGFYFYAFYRVLANIYLVEAILCVLAIIPFLKKATSLGRK